MQEAFNNVTEYLILLEMLLFISLFSSRCQQDGQATGRGPGEGGVGLWFLVPGSHSLESSALSLGLRIQGFQVYF